MARKDLFSTVHTEGNLLPSEVLAHILAEKELPGLKAADYFLPAGERINEEVTHDWNRILAAWRRFRPELEKFDESRPGTKETRQNWLLVLFNALGYGRLEPAPAHEIEEKRYPISHQHKHVPLHLLGAGLSLDRRVKGVAGAATSSPHSMVQEFLNRSEGHLWAILSNGKRLRLLRDNVSLTRQAYLEFDLQGMMDGEVFPDFKLLWMLCHESRIHSDQPHECWLEKWHQQSGEVGTRALNHLRQGVKEAISALGRGFLSHRGNAALHEKLRQGRLDRLGYYRQLLRLVYRLLFLFVAEDRDLLLLSAHDGQGEQARQRYLQFYSTHRLRALAERKRGTRHTDLGQSLWTVMELLGHDDGCPGLALPPLGSFLWDGQKALPDLRHCLICNSDLLEAVRALAFIQHNRTLRAIDYRNLGSEELGSVYESLLELHPELNLDAGSFSLSTASGNERKTSGSYYTPPELVQCLLDSALEPVVQDRLAEARKACRGKTPETLMAVEEKALLEISVCDPACGSGHFLIAAAHRLARHLAAVRTGEGEPPPSDVQHALRDVISHCIYGVDINPMAVELCKVSLWMDAIDPGRPLSFLDNKILCGNSLFGATPALLAQGIPDEAFSCLLGDDKKLTSALKKRNKQERESGQRTLAAEFSYAADESEAVDFSQCLLELEMLGDERIDHVHLKEQRYQQCQATPAYQAARLVGDAWCSAFVCHKQANAPQQQITDAVFRQIQSHPTLISRGIVEEIERLRYRYQFFHWHLAFPKVFPTGKPGGFDVVLGNPPWERIKLQEQEWFAERDPEVAKAANAAERKRRIEALRKTNPELLADFEEDLRQAEAESSFLRASGRYPLCGRGDINTYAVFAETNRSLVALKGRAGFIVPTGIVSDDTTKDYFGALVAESTIAAVHSFENEDRLFPTVHHAFKFCLLVMSGAARPVQAADFVFYLRRASCLEELERHFSLSAEDIRRLNPNTRTCPIFRGSRDAEINKAIYRRLPVLIREGPPEENPWGLTFMAMLHMANDSHLFQAGERLEAEGWILDGNRYRRGDQHCLPLYEAKMLHHFDHRFSTYQGQTEAQAKMNKCPELKPEQHADPHHQVQPRYWVDSHEVEARLSGRWDRGWMLGWRDITNTTNERTVIACLMPRAGTGDTFLLAMPATATAYSACLYANLCSFALDYAARQKIGGTHLKYHVFKQLPVLPPSAYDAPCPWQPELSLRDWILPRVLELTYTAWDMQPFAQDLGHSGPPFRWDEERRFHLRCELDAAFFHLYGLNADDTAYIMDTFPTVRKYEEKDHGCYRSKATILQIYNQMDKCSSRAGTRA